LEEEMLENKRVDVERERKLKARKKEKREA